MARPALCEHKHEENLSSGMHFLLSVGDW